eukprot:GHRR01005511.1.p1 GENE.GHRR01005511.1~~GHRR01005511.1.p1  ORF type:complete len:188 (+),score=33.16 GHRR01005511.1:270-833(+)
MQASAEEDSSPAAQLAFRFNQQLQIFLDRCAPLILPRWIAWGVFLCLYALRVWLLKGFYIVTYGLGIYNLNLLLGFITPQTDPELEDGPQLPTKSDQEFKPFVRRLPEFKFWWSSIKSIWIGLLMTFFTMFDVPVFWPILLMYWLLLFVVTMKRQIKHMIKYRYLPFTVGKKRYSASSGKKDPAAGK